MNDMSNEVGKKIMLRDGSEMQITAYKYPVTSRDRTMLIDLLQQVYPRTDVDWLQSMRGVYADVLETHQWVGWIEDEPVGSASVAFACVEPEACVIEDVMTVPEYRGLGIARTLAEHAVQKAFAAGCRVAYLGNAPVDRSVYETIGFERVSGVFMRRAAPGHEDYEKVAFAPGQSTSIRDTNWGDLPGTACLAAQPMQITLSDYSQGFASTSCAPGTRCVSAFTSVKYETETRGGIMLSLVGATPHRILGFARAVPGPGGLRAKTARVDGVTCDAFVDQGPHLVTRLLDWLATKQIAHVQAFVARRDRVKQQWFESSGFTCNATLPESLHYEDRWEDILVFQQRL